MWMTIEFTFSFITYMIRSGGHGSRFWQIWEPGLVKIDSSRLNFNSEIYIKVTLLSTPPALMVWRPKGVYYNGWKWGGTPNFLDHQVDKNQIKYNLWSLVTFSTQTMRNQSSYFYAIFCAFIFLKFGTIYFEENFFSWL